MVVLLSHFPGKKLLLVGSIFILHDILRIPRVSNIFNISFLIFLLFNIYELLFPLTCGNLILEGLRNYRLMCNIIRKAFPKTNQII